MGTWILGARFRLSTSGKRSQRNQLKEVEKHFQDKSSGCKFPLHKLGLLILLASLYVMLSYSLRKDLSNPSSGWIEGGSDQRYTSICDTSWDDITSVLESKNKSNHFHGIGILNFNVSEIKHWKDLTPNLDHTILNLKHADENVTWDSLYPEWIDEEENNELPLCPSLPKIRNPKRHLDLIVVKLPCQNKRNWSRDVARLHLQLATASLATSLKGNYDVYTLFHTNCLPIPNLFRCKDQVARKGNAWLYKPNLNVLRQKLKLPIGSCELSLSWKKKDIVYPVNVRREAYATILHSAHDYVCGAIAIAHRIRKLGSNRDLVILVDETISSYHKSGLEAAGWKIRIIQRIRNPKAEKDAYNEWNYSKFRLWQLTSYDKIIFVDADLLILRNIDFLFEMPEISATGNDATLFNSGVMVIEPSNCTFCLLMDHIGEFESYNGGDQGYLNEVFTWWHRIPKHLNFLKHFWVGDKDETKQMKTRLFVAKPPILYVLHYLGVKPWLCFRDYDCNWNNDIMHEFASDVAHKTWWNVHDEMPELLQQFCLLRSKQKAILEWNRRKAEQANYIDGHWRIKIHDGRLNKCIDKLCSWESMLKHWGEKNWTEDNSFTSAPPVISLTFDNYSIGVKKIVK